MNAGEMPLRLDPGDDRDEQSRPLRTQPSLLTVVVPLGQRVRIAAGSAAADPNRRNAEAHRVIRISRRRLQRGSESELLGRVQRREQYRSALRLIAVRRSNADRVELERDLLRGIGIRPANSDQT